MGLCVAILSKKLATKRDKEVAREAYIVWFEKTLERVVLLISASDQEVTTYRRLAKSLFMQVTEIGTPVKVRDFVSCFGVDYQSDSEPDEEASDDSMETEIKVASIPQKSTKKTTAAYVKRKSSLLDEKAPVPEEKADNDNDAQDKEEETTNEESHRTEKEMGKSPSESDKTQKEQKESPKSDADVSETMSDCTIISESHPSSFAFDDDTSFQVIINSGHAPLLILVNLLHTFLDEIVVMYDARSRALVCELARFFNYSKTRVILLEHRIAMYVTSKKVNEVLKHDDEALLSHKKQNRRRRWILTGIAAAGMFACFIMTCARFIKTFSDA
jgi:hypothetical protein